MSELRGRHASDSLRRLGLLCVAGGLRIVEWTGRRLSQVGGVGQTLQAWSLKRQEVVAEKLRARP